jgi:hypothetical protein
MRVADVKLSWKPSVSTDVASQRVVVSIDGQETLNADVSATTEEMMIEVNAQSSVVFAVFTTDFEGNESQSESYTFTIGDLEAPQPASLLGHEIVAVRDVVVPDPDNDLIQ